MILVGLIVTFIALASVALGLPSAVALSGGGFAFLTLGAVGLFLGGTLLGFAAGIRRGGRR